MLMRSILHKIFGGRYFVKNCLLAKNCTRSAGEKKFLSNVTKSEVCIYGALLILHAKTTSVVGGGI